LGVGIGVVLALGALGIWWWQGDSDFLLSLFSLLGPMAAVGVFIYSRFKDADSAAAASARVDLIRRVGKLAVEQDHKDMERTPLRWTRTDTSPAGPIGRDGTIAELISRYAGSPCRLIVLGAGGAGKTAMCYQLIVTLLKGNPARIPVLIRLSSWDGQDPFDDWVVGHISSEYLIPLGEARKLVSDQAILPVLDALDERHDRSVVVAMRTLRRSVLLRNAFVLTCRDTDFDAAKVEHVLPKDVVVRLLPFSEQEVAQGIDWAAGDDRRWEPVVEAVRHDPHGPVAAALTTTLMLFLLIRAYDGQTDRDPGELVDPVSYPDGESIRKRLVELCLETSLQRLNRREYADGRRNLRWFTFIAQHLCHRDTGRLGWWEFHKAVPASIFVTVTIVMGGAISSLLGWLLLGLYGRPVQGALLGALVGLASGALFTLHGGQDTPRDLPRLLRPDGSVEQAAARRLAVITAIVAALAGGIGAYLVTQELRDGILAGIAFGVPLGVTRWVVTRPPRWLSDTVSPTQVIRADRNAGIVSGLVGGGTGIIVGAVVGSRGIAWSRLGLVFNPGGPWQEAMVGAGVGLVLGFFGGLLMIQATSAWGRLLTTRLVLAATGRTPLRLMGLLEDATTAGVLRQLGPQYEFRSEIFRRHLLVRGQASPADRSEAGRLAPADGMPSS